ncbi:hypothetical protein [Geobacter grbiciae]|uniref:hypothetical protein n=1 Tax=Geobacter grbiciae TaxID=155042 RepID=UPI001C029530|nr:hypothetical protein [Geobacter grbiciae]MBT1075707.1 hypothetical protein [Geobacter grbiciae]
MNGRTYKLVTGIISLFIALFLAWRIGLWLEPEPKQRNPAPAVPSPAAKEPPFVTGTVRKDLNFEVRNVRFGNRGKTVEGIGIVTFDSDRSDLKAAAVAMLKKLKEKVPAAERIVLTLKPSVDCPVCAMAEVTWDRGKVDMRYGIPSLEQMEEANTLIGTKDKKGETVDRPRLYLPDRETFAAGLAITQAIDAARKKNPSLGDDQLLEQAAAATGLNYAVARRSRDFMAAYYTATEYGEETFTLSLP